uniref:SP-RING-type domain-containing protein n=1 Tax=Arcella intermedia TaxID=1963864 RepID=A0A6B2KYW4_9EUKA
MNIYRGNFDGQKQLHGIGVKMSMADGIFVRYEGEFRFGQVNGLGRYIDSDKTECVANWENSQFHGNVIQIHKSGVTIGSDGLVVNTFADGRRYEGMYSQGKWHGYGVETKEDNYTWAGEWKDGERHLGVVTTFQSTGSVQKYWQQGTMGNNFIATADIAKQNAIKKQNEARQVAHAIYRTLPGEVAAVVLQAREVETLAKELSNYAIIAQKKCLDKTSNDDVCVTSEVVSLKCALSLSRIQTPAKGIRCLHYQCFDKESWLGLKVRPLVCPICARWILGDEELVIDAVFGKLLADNPTKDNADYPIPKAHDYPPYKKVVIPPPKFAVPAIAPTLALGTPIPLHTAAPAATKNKSPGMRTLKKTELDKEAAATPKRKGAATPATDRKGKKQKVSGTAESPLKVSAHSVPSPGTPKQDANGIFRVRKKGASLWKRIKVQPLTFENLKLKIAELKLLENDEELSLIYELPDTVIDGDADLELVQNPDLEFTTKKAQPHKEPEKAAPKEVKAYPITDDPLKAVDALLARPRAHYTQAEVQEEIVRPLVKFRQYMDEKLLVKVLAFLGWNVAGGAPGGSLDMESCVALLEGLLMDAGGGKRQERRIPERVLEVCEEVQRQVVGIKERKEELLKVVRSAFENARKKAN